MKLLYIWWLGLLHKHYKRKVELLEAARPGYRGLFYADAMAKVRIIELKIKWARGE